MCETTVKCAEVGSSGGCCEGLEDGTLEETASSASRTPMHESWTPLIRSRPVYHMYSYNNKLYIQCGVYTVQYILEIIEFIQYE